MSRRCISFGSHFEELARYSRAVVDGDLIVVSGTLGPDPQTGAMPESAEEQARNSFTIIERALKEGGGSLADVVQCRVYVTAVDHVQEIVQVLAEKFEKIRPTNTTVICQLPVAGAKVEIEILAKLKGGSNGL
jgi:enamine deaminase RidA (YjgF/YER057c/UK114 family)